MLNDLAKRLDALEKIEEILRLHLELDSDMTRNERAHYQLMLKSAEMFLERRNFGRVTRDYREIIRFLRKVEARLRDAA